MDETEEDEEDDLEAEERDSFTESTEDEDEQILRADRSGAVGPDDPAWEGEQLPANAVNLQKKRRMSSNRARAAAIRARDRRLRSLEDDDEEERGRSRSRSPKRLTSSTSRESRGSFSSGSGRRIRDLGSGGSRTASSEDREPQLPASAPPASRLPRSSTPADGKDAGLRLQNGLPTLDGGANERTPLLSRENQGLMRPPTTAQRRASADLRARAKSQRLAHQGTSTFLQSWFNTLNALVGVGILALPLAFSYAGWIGGPVLFLLAGFLTNYTGKVLAEIMAKQPTLRTYADIGSYAFGPKARVLVSMFFCLELWAVCVALIMLFADSVSALMDGLPIAVYKAIGLVIILPTIFLPLKLLSPVSVIGIISTFTLFAVVLADALIKKESPGSIWQPAHTTVLPQWSRLPLSFGLIMSGFSSHPVIPSLVKDMEDPRRFPAMLNLAYIAATIIYMGMGIVGYAMYGTNVSDEITRDIARTPGFPEALNKVALWLIVINPLSKFALAARPINTTFEVLFGIEASQVKMMQRSVKRKVSSKSVNNNRASMHSNGSATDPSYTAEAESNSSSASGPHQGLSPSGHVNPLAGSAISIRAAERASAWSPVLRLSASAAIRVVIAALITLTAIGECRFQSCTAQLLTSPSAPQCCPDSKR